jgi:hypothetical protein
LSGFRAVDPVAFKIGDIVKAMVATNHKTVKLHLMLRALALMDHTERHK